jgi:hypothetical protein
VSSSAAGKRLPLSQRQLRGEAGKPGAGIAAPATRPCHPGAGPHLHGAIQPPEGRLPAAVTGLHLSGVAAASPLAAALRAALGTAVSISSGGAAPRHGRWQARLRGTNLDWSGPTAPSPAADPGEAVLLDLHGLEATRARRLWRVVDASGRAVLSPWFGRERCCGSQALFSLFLVQSLDGGRNWSRIGAAHLSGRRRYPQLLRAVGIALVAMIRRAILAPEPAPPWQPEPIAHRDTPWRWRLGFLRKQLHDKLTTEHWAIGLASIAPERLLAGEPLMPERWLALPPAEGFLADPFPWPGRPGLLLCERFDHASGLGRLQALRLDAGPDIPAAEVPLGLRCHLSYPFTWEEGGRIYCLPEMAASRRQVLYELQSDAPPRPTVTIAEDVAMADATLFRHGGLLWLAYTDGDLGLDDNLCLRWAERLEGPWTPHRLNPVKFDLRSSRCAGPVFAQHGELIRPAQDCSGGYGSALVLNRILHCTPESYREEAVARIAPDPDGPYPDGVHTLSMADGVILTDGKRVVFDPWVVLRRIQRRLPGRRGRPATS